MTTENSPLTNAPEAPTVGVNATAESAVTESYGVT